MPSDLLSVEGLEAAWGTTPVLRGVSFGLAPGEFLVLMGPNGSGKSTLLRTVAGLERPTGGRVVFEGANLAGVPPHRRGIGMLFQEAALFPGRTVGENVAYGLEVRRWARPRVDERVAEVTRRLGVDRLLERPVEQLSGGEKQRVSLARTLAPRPRLVLLDEPFASVDPVFRGELRAEFRAALRDEGVAAVHVTHDREEGLFLADRVALLFEGTLDQVGTPQEVYARPRTARAARFLGLNVVPTAAGPVAVPPEEVRLVDVRDSPLAATVVAVGIVGRLAEVHLRTTEGDTVVVRVERLSFPLRAGDKVGLRWDSAVTLPPASR